MTDEEIEEQLLGKPVDFGIWAYGDRMGNRAGTEDGFTYRGGGIFQTTGRLAYKEKGERAGIDLAGRPDLIEIPSNSMLTACFEWKDLGANELADNDDLKRISRGVNLGDKNSGTKANGEEDRGKLLKRIKPLLGI